MGFNTPNEKTFRWFIALNTESSLPCGINVPDENLNASQSLSLKKWIKYWKDARNCLGRPVSSPQSSDCVHVSWQFNELHQTTDLWWFMTSELIHISLKKSLKKLSRNYIFQVMLQPGLASSFCGFIITASERSQVPQNTIWRSFSGEDEISHLKMTWFT